MLSDDARVAVLGATGYIGSRLIRSDSERYVQLPCRRVESQSDAEALVDEVADFMGSGQSTVLVNCMGMRNGPVSQMQLINAEVPMRLAAAADEFGFHLIHLASAAEIVYPIGTSTLTEYQTSKREGTEACLAHANVTAIRVFNLHGLPHQADSGLHAICQACHALREGRDPERLVDTLRDYVSWESVIRGITAASIARRPGLMECSTGIGVRISEIVAALPSDLAAELNRSIVPANLYSSAVGTNSSPGIYIERSALIATLAEEVVGCGFS